jgi:hypothetical protein
MDQFDALQKFTRSIGRAVLRWPRRWGREPIAHRRWRHARSIVLRFSLAYDAGIAQGPYYDQLFYELHQREQKLHTEWLRVKQRRAMLYLTGRRKRCPRWCSC